MVTRVTAIPDDWSIGITTETVDKGYIRNNTGVGPDLIPGDISIDYVEDTQPCKNYIEFEALILPVGMEPTFKTFESTGEARYTIPKAADIVSVARYIRTSIAAVTSSSVADIPEIEAAIIAKYDARMLSNGNGFKLWCRIKRDSVYHVRAFDITDETVTLKDINTGEVSGITGLAVGDQFELVNAYDILKEGLEQTTGYPTYGYVKKHVEPGQDAFIEFGKYDIPPKLKDESVIVGYYALENYSPEYPFFDAIDKYDLHPVSEKLDFPVTVAQVEKAIQDLHKYVDPLKTITLVTRRPSLAQKGWKIYVNANGYPPGYYTVVSRTITRETEKSTIEGKGIVTQVVELASYEDTFSKLLASLKLRNDVSKAKLAEVQKERTRINLNLNFSFSELTVTEVENTYRTDNLLAYYPFTEDANDASGNDNHGTLLGGASISSGSLLIRNNNTDRCRLPYTIAHNKTAWSTCFWVKINTLHAVENYVLSGALNPPNSNQLLVGYRQDLENWNLYRNGTGVNFDNDTTVEDGNWCHVGVTIASDGAAKLYINGSLIDGSKSVSSSAFNIANNGFLIGQEQDSVDGTFDANQCLAGNTCHMFFYDTDISEDDINDCMNYVIPE